MAGTKDLNWSFDGLNATICFVVSAMMNESQIVQLAKIFFLLHWYWGFKTSTIVSPFY